jgi:hypothetical protein
LRNVVSVLELSGREMRAQEIHTAAEELVGEPLRWTSVKAALAAGAAGSSPRFRRVRHGVYRLEPLCTSVKIDFHLQTSNRTLAQPGVV